MLYHKNYKIYDNKLKKKLDKSDLVSLLQILVEVSTLVDWCTDLSGHLGAVRLVFLRPAKDVRVCTIEQLKYLIKRGTIIVPWVPVV